MGEVPDPMAQKYRADVSKGKHLAAFPGGEGDVVDALSQKPGLRFDELIAVVHGTGDTLFAFSDAIAEVCVRCMASSQGLALHAGCILTNIYLTSVVSCAKPRPSST